MYIDTIQFVKNHCESVQIIHWRQECVNVIPLREQIVVDFLFIDKTTPTFTTQ